MIWPCSTLTPIPEAFPWDNVLTIVRLAKIDVSLSELQTNLMLDNCNPNLKFTWVTIGGGNVCFSRWRGPVEQLEAFTTMWMWVQVMLPIYKKRCNFQKNAWLLFRMDVWLLIHILMSNFFFWWVTWLDFDLVVLTISTIYCATGFSS